MDEEKNDQVNGGEEASAQPVGGDTDGAQAAGVQGETEENNSQEQNTAQ